MVEAKEIGCGNTLSRELALARQAEQQATRLARDVRTLVAWLSHAILALAGPDLAQRRSLFDFIIAELGQREHLDSARIRPVRRALENQRDDLLAVAGVLDTKLAGIAHNSKVCIDLVRGLLAATQVSPVNLLLAALESTAREVGRQIPRCRRCRGRGNEAYPSGQLNG